MKLPQEFFNEAAEIARLAFDPDLTGCAVLVWPAVPGVALDLLYELEGWSDGAWVVNDTKNPPDRVSAGSLADAQDVKFFSYFLLGVRGACKPGEGPKADARRFERFEAAGGELGKYAWTGAVPRASQAS